MSDFSIRKFKTTLDAYGGPANPSMFRVNIYRSSDASDLGQADMTFLCHATNMPGINLITQQYRPDGIGMAQEMPIGMEAERLDCVFFLDDDHQVLTYFHDWIQKVYNYAGYDGKLKSMPNDFSHLPYEIGYRDDYSCTMTMEHFSVDGETYVYKFSNVFPVDIGSVRLSWADPAGPMDLPVHFSYSAFTVTGASISSTLSERVDGTSLLEKYNTMVNSIKNALS
jgi:hypothetical protein